MAISKSIIFNTDSYKYPQWQQYPPNTRYVYSYIESRGGKWKDLIYLSFLHAFFDEYFQPITQEDIDLASELIPMQGLPFYREGWQYILDEYDGKLPLVIHSAKEGTIIPVKNVLVTIQNTDPKCWWLTSFVETAILRQVWYPTTVGTNSFQSKQIIMEYLHKNGTLESIDYKLNDFGARGVSSFESSCIGGAAHLVNFKGTDNIPAILYAREHLDCTMAGHSVPAMEHSTVTSWTKEGELDSYRNMLNCYANPGAIVAVVSDSYNIYEACEHWGTTLKQQVIDSGATIVVRPDSGDPPMVIMQCLQILDKHFGHTINSKGYKVLNHIRLIQGDGINQEMISRILHRMDVAGYSADNIAFGQGGDLLQNITRDTLKFAMKCSACDVNGVWRDVYKQPITDFGKESKKGRVTLYKNDDGYYTDLVDDNKESCLIKVFENGEILKRYTMDELRQNSIQ